MKHRGRAVVFENYENYHARIADPDLDIDETCVMVLKNCGPKGYPGMPEVGNLGLPPKLLKKGVADMVRISDARMSGTAYGTVVLHVSPEAAAGGPLAAIENGDMIELDVEKGLLSVDLTDEAIAARLKMRGSRPPIQEDGYAGLYRKHVLQADEGCDFDFLIGSRGAEVPADSH
jgi:dihydroxyacid dehydratase/phosphogluconate dehydratase